MIAKCLTVHQPWAWAIVHGHLQVVSRSRKTDHRGPLFIHAARERDLLSPTEQVLPGGPPMPTSHQLAYGALIGVAELVDCFLTSAAARGLTGGRGPWSWLFTDARPLPAPIPCSGKSHIWGLPEELAGVMGMVRET